MRDGISCESRQESIAAFVLGLLEPPASRELCRHFESCDLCRGVRDALVEEEASVRTAFDAIARSVNTDQDALVESFGRAADKQDQAVRLRGLKGRTIGRGWPIMKTHYKPVSIVAATLLVASVGAVLLWPTHPSQYALGQTINALREIQFIHTVMRDDQRQVMDERWIEMGPDGNQARYRQDAKVPQAGVSLLVIDDGNICYTYDRQKNVVVLKPSGSYQWIYNLREFFQEIKGDSTVTVDQDAEYRGRSAYKVRWLDHQMECFIDPRTLLPLTVGPMELAYGEPPDDAFTIPSPPDGVRVVDMRGDSPDVERERDKQREKAVLFMEGRKALAIGDCGQAVELLGRAIQMSPLENWIWYWRGDAHAGLGQWEAAIADYTRVIDIFKMVRQTPHYACLARGMAWQQMGRTQEAKADLAVALPVMIDALRHPEGGKQFDYADMPTDVNAALSKLTPDQRRQNMISRLRKATGQHFGYELGKEGEQLQDVIYRWESWWEQESADYRSQDNEAQTSTP